VNVYGLERIGFPLTGLLFVIGERGVSCHHAWRDGDGAIQGLPMTIQGFGKNRQGILRI